MTSEVQRSPQITQAIAMAHLQARVHTANTPAFDAKITPTSSMSVGTFIFGLFAIATLSIVALFGLIFTDQWLSTVLLALVAIAIVIALISVHSDRDRHENVVVDDRGVAVSRVSNAPSNYSVELPHGAIVVEGRSGPVGLLSIHLRSGRTRIEIARDLTNAERQAFLEAFLGSFAPPLLQPRLEIQQIGGV
ncbi:MAG: DUF2244 domain-containing protein [Hyphomicrobium sp.]|nr:DUF2244 domain-containing protein [Hyphomicrobium sp.]